MLSEAIQVTTVLRKINPKLATEENTAIIYTSEYKRLIIDGVWRLKPSGLLDDEEQAKKIIDEIVKAGQFATVKANEMLDCYIRNSIGEDLASNTKVFESIKATPFGLKETLTLFKSIQEMTEELELKDTKLIHEVYSQVYSYGYCNILKMQLFINKPVLIAMAQAGSHLSKVTTALSEVADLLQFDEKRLAISMSIIDVITESKDESMKASRAILRLNQYNLLVYKHVEALRGTGDKVDEKVKEIICEHINSLLRVVVANEEKLKSMIIAVERMVILTYSIELKQFIDGLSELIKRIKEYGLGEHAEEILGEIMASKNPNQVITSLLQSYIFNGLKYADGNVTIALKALTLLNYLGRSPILSEEHIIRAIVQAGVGAEALAKALIFLDKKCNIVSMLKPEMIEQLSSAGMKALEIAENLFDVYLQKILSIGFFTQEESRELTNIIKSKNDDQIKIVVLGLESVYNKIKKTFPEPALKAIFCAIIDYWDYREPDASVVIKLFKEDCTLNVMALSSTPEVLCQALVSVTRMLTRMGDDKKIVIDALFAAREKAESLAVILKDMYAYNQNLFRSDKIELIIQLIVASNNMTCRIHELRKALYMLNSAQMLTEIGAEQCIKELSESIEPLQKASELIEKGIISAYQRYVIEDVSSKIKGIQETKDKISALRNVTQRGGAYTINSPYLNIKELIPDDLQKLSRILNVIYNRILEQNCSYTVLKLFSNQHVLKVIVEAGGNAEQLSFAFVKLNPDLLYFNVKYSEKIINVIVAAGSNAELVVQAFNIIWDAQFLYGERTPGIVEQIEGAKSNAVVKAKQLVDSFVAEILASVTPFFSKEKYREKIMDSFSRGEHFKLRALQKYEEDIKALWESLKKLYPERECPSEGVVDIIFDTVIDNLNFYTKDKRDENIINYAKILSDLLHGEQGPELFVAIKEYKHDDAGFRKRLNIILSPRHEELRYKVAFIRTVLGIDESLIDKLEQAFIQIIKASKDGKGGGTDDVIRSLGVAVNPYQTAWRLICKTEVPEEKLLSTGTSPSLSGRLGVTKPILRRKYQKVSFFDEIRFNDGTRKPLSETYCRAYK